MRPGLFNLKVGCVTTSNLGSPDFSAIVKIKIPVVRAGEPA
ncbi:MAG: hypothetical protein U7126_29035 [Microcoleus sp.]